MRACCVYVCALCIRYLFFIGLILHSYVAILKELKTGTLQMLFDELSAQQPEGPSEQEQ
jgi:hypothetical protein